MSVCVFVRVCVCVQPTPPLLLVIFIKIHNSFKSPRMLGAGNDFAELRFRAAR